MVATSPALTIKAAARFQRAIHVRYDLNDPQIVERYIPTLSAVSAIDAILRGTHNMGTQRAHVLHAAYGSGKSHLAVVLAALLEKKTQLLPSIEELVSRLVDIDPQVGSLAYAYLNGTTRLLPVVLSGNEGDFTTALLRALSRSLRIAGLEEVQLTTRFDAALNIIAQWETQYPDTFIQLSKTLNDRFSWEIADLRNALAEHNLRAFETFEQLYPDLTAGATLDPFSQQTPEVVYREVATQLHDAGYTGIVVLWDEFGRYLESRAAQAFGIEAGLLQNFAETCNYSGENQLHLLLFAHKELQGYASSLPQAYQVEWSRIEGRFQKHNVSTDPYVAYRLVASAFEYDDEPLGYRHLDADVVDRLVRWSMETHLFGVFSSEVIRDLIYKTWPLHPLTVFALVHLSNRVAQNERTMFTFLASDEPGALQQLANSLDSADVSPFILPAVLWDYFEDAIRVGNGRSEAHRIWSGVLSALDKVAEHDLLGKVIVKTLGVLLICAESSVVRPTTELLSWAVGTKTDEQHAAVVTILDNLRRRKVIINRQIDGYWTFIAGSDINFEARLTEILERVNPTPIQLRRLLEQTLAAPYTLARRYNQEYAITRYFTGLYRWPNEIVDAPWDMQIRQLDTDGLVVYILAADETSWAEGLKAIQDHDRVVYVFPHQDHLLVSLPEVLRELYGLHEINNDPTLRQHEDRERIQREIDWLLEDAQARLASLVNGLIDPRQGKSVWITCQAGELRGRHVHSPSQTTQIVSQMCAQVFPKTPVFNSEGLNKRKPSAPQVKAAQKVIDALFTHEPDETFGLEGRGPEILALNALLRLPGVLRPMGDDTWEFGRPEGNSHLAEIWDLIDSYVSSGDSGERLSVEPLVKTLTAPPYGLRQGVVPVLIAAVLRNHLKVTTVWRDRRPITPVDGDLLTQMVDQASHFTIEIGEWNEQLESLWQALVSRFDAYIHDNERGQQPLNMLRVAAIRWLQGLPAFCRYTSKLTREALQFRNIIRKAQTEPAKALFEFLPGLLGLDEDTEQSAIEAQLDALMTEISNAYLDLQRRLDTFAMQEFGVNGYAHDGQQALKSWLTGIGTIGAAGISQFKFGSLVTQDLVDTISTAKEGDGQFWDKISRAALGIHLRDWNDDSEERFREKLLTAREEVEREIQELIEEDRVVILSLQLPDEAPHDYRFRASDLSSQGRRLLQNFKSTFEIAGRPLSSDEKRQIAVAFLAYVMGEDVED